MSFETKEHCILICIITQINTNTHKITCYCSFTSVKILFVESIEISSVVFKKLIVLHQNFMGIEVVCLTVCSETNGKT